jgi:Protein of unknown function (DUF2878)
MNAPAARSGMNDAKPSVLANFVLFQIGWFACVAGAAHDMALAGSGVALVIVVLHVARAVQPLQALKLVLVALLIGTVWDSALLATGWVRFSSGIFIQGIAPNWILTLWALFATTLNVSLTWLRGRWLLLILFGAVGGPLSYWGGVRMGAMTLVDPLPALLALAIGWAVIMVLLMLAAKRLNGFVVEGV